MQERIALRAYIDEAGVESRHELSHTPKIDVADGVACLVPFLVLVFHQILVFEQGHGNLLRLNINDKFACHCLYY